MITRQRAGKFDPNSMARHPAAPAWGHINRRSLIGAALTGTVLVATTVPEVLARTSEQVPLDEVKLTFFEPEDRKSTRLNSSHVAISYAVFCLKKKIRVHHQRPLESYHYEV